QIRGVHDAPLQAPRSARYGSGAAVPSITYFTLRPHNSTVDARHLFAPASFGAISSSVAGALCWTIATCLRACSSASSFDRSDCAAGTEGAPSPVVCGKLAGAAGAVGGAGARWSDWPGPVTTAVSFEFCGGLGRGTTGSAATVGAGWLGVGATVADRFSKDHCRFAMANSASALSALAKSCWCLKK